MHASSDANKGRAFGLLLAWARRRLLASLCGVIVGGIVGVVLGAVGSFVYRRVLTRLAGRLDNESYGWAADALSVTMLYATLGMLLGAILGAVLELVLRRKGIRRAATLLGWLALLLYGVICENVPFMLSRSPGGLLPFLALMIPGALLAGLVAAIALDVLGVDETLIGAREGAAAGFLVGASVILAGGAMPAMIIGGCAYGALSALRILEA